ncbi:MAG: hypothetical protein HRT88_13935, partial [Lentisphaeraceae bacterium]|nr:hypothetical protein [Lentisphaeraceae bacterium]
VTPQSSVNNTNGDKANFPSGYSLQGSLILGDNAMTIPLHTSFAPRAESGANNGNVSASPGKSSTTASPVGKKFGPVIIDSIGLGLRDGGIGLKFTGGLVIGPVEFDLIGFEITSPITHFEPDITIQGLGLDIKKGALDLKGLMMEGNVDIPEMDYSTGKITTEALKAYSGALSIKYKQYNLDAFGSYAQLPDGSPTMFLYAFLGTPLGGPPVFFVTGVAAGFGYNRTFNLPAINEISTFPLIEPVMGTGGQPAESSTPAAGDSTETSKPAAKAPTDNFAAMNKDFLPKEGAFWGAVGVRGETFKMVETFVLLDVQFNESIEIDLIGISNMTFPKAKDGEKTDPLAKIIIGIEARILPEQGVLRVDGTLQPGTYILDSSAHITGGFGMISIFADQHSGTYNGAKEGDFVFSIGGYSSSYKTPAYYPQPQRLQLNWQINPIHSIKGSAYFAIDTKAMMAGGAFENLYKIGGLFDISASFIIGADFIIYWKPYHYTAALSLEIDVSAQINLDLWLFSVHLDFNLDLGADLQIWGPPFAGKGQVYVHVIVSFSVDVSFGDANPVPKPIDFAEFCTSFLPDTDKILSAAIASGLAPKAEQAKDSKAATVGVVNPKDMSVVCHTAFPLKTVKVITSPKLNTDPKTSVVIGGSSNTDFGIAPMAKTSDDVKSSLTVTISKDGNNYEGNFNYKVITRNLPSAMWQFAEYEGVIPDTKGKALIENLICGIEITPKPQAAEVPFTITEPGEEIILMPPAQEVETFNYETANFSLGA